MIGILIVEDNQHLLESMLEQLNLEADFDAVGVTTLAEASKRMGQNFPDVLLLDVALPDGDGRSLCRQIRAEGHHFPILMLTAQNGEMDTIDGLESGANDYIAKPVRIGELITRIRLHLKHYRARADIRLTLGPFMFNPAHKTLLHQGTAARIILTEKETAIIRYLIEKKGEIAGREELLEKIWGYNDRITTHTLETHIYRLRQKMGAVDPTPIIITTRNGYTLRVFSNL